MNRAFFLKKEDRSPQWRLIDAQGKVLGRLATEIAEALRGKDKPDYTPHTDGGDYIVVINAEKVALTGNKLNGKKGKVYARYTGYIGGYKETTAQEMMEKNPEHLIEKAVQGMLPDNRLSRQVIKKLKVYAGSEHPHKAQLSKA